MDLSSRLRSWVYARPRALVVDPPGQDVLRWAVEAALDERGWDLAASPADTDVLVVLGEPTSPLSDAVDVLWSQVPRPRAAVVISDATLVEEQLDAAIDRLVSRVPETAEPPDADPGDQLSAARPPVGEDGDAAHDTSDHTGHDMAGHGGMVAGLPMAQTAQDRDGLQLDTLAIALGPVLPGWPTGLVLRAQLQGDVLSDVQLSWLAGAGPGGRPTAADDSQVAALDQLARFLLVAGWPAQARQARRALAGLRSADPAVRSRAASAAQRVARRVRRSRSLAWSVSGIGALPAVDVASSDAPPPAREDVLDRLRQWCDRAGRREDVRPVAPVALEALARALDGAELATARLVVASAALDPVVDPAAVTGA